MANANLLRQYSIEGSYLFLHENEEYMIFIIMIIDQEASIIYPNFQNNLKYTGQNKVSLRDFVHINSKCTGIQLNQKCNREEYIRIRNYKRGYQKCLPIHPHTFLNGTAPNEKLDLRFLFKITFLNGTAFSFQITNTLPSQIQTYCDTHFQY